MPHLRPTRPIVISKTSPDFDWPAPLTNTVLSVSSFLGFDYDWPKLQPPSSASWASSSRLEAAPTCLCDTFWHALGTRKGQPSSRARRGALTLGADPNPESSGVRDLPSTPVFLRRPNIKRHELVAGDAVCRTWPIPGTAKSGRARHYTRENPHIKRLARHRGAIFRRCARPRPRGRRIGVSN